MAEKAPKTAYEVAMERLRKRDAEQGIIEQPLTDEQKAEIAEIRRVYEARLAQAEVMHRSALNTTLDPEAIATIEQEYQRDRERLNSERESKVEKARSG